LQPDRAIDPGAQAVHGITAEFLADKPRFQEIADAFLAFIKDAVLIIHNAPFDLGFLDAELNRVNKKYGYVEDHAVEVIDTLALARRMHPGQKNSLDALCKRYGVDNGKRTLHGALLDSEILADIYLAMTGGQNDLSWEAEAAPQVQASTLTYEVLSATGLKVVEPTTQELAEHEAYWATDRR
jgi:DNA polymerase-3 subunit epsilon